MKKLFLFLTIATLIFTSCSSDDNTPTATKDPIIGTWHTVFAEGKTLNDCKKRTNYKFNEDGTAQLTEYALNTNNSCEKVQEVPIKWSKKSDNLYTIESVKTDSQNDPPLDVTITFSDNNTKAEFLGMKLEKR